MPRRPRVVLPHIPLHLIQRGNNRQVCFVADEDQIKGVRHNNTVITKGTHFVLTHCTVKGVRVNKIQ